MKTLKSKKIRAIKKRAKRLGYDTKISQGSKIHARFLLNETIKDAK